MTLVQLYPRFEILDGLSIEEQSWAIARAYGICNGWRVNFAIDDEGQSFGSSGSSADVSSNLDRLLLSKLRSMSDVIVTSGRTARVEKYRSSKFAPIAIFSKSGDLDSVPAIQGTQYFTPLVLSPYSEIEAIEESLSDVDVLVLAYPENLPSGLWPRAIAQLLHREGFQSPILESGLSTIREFLASEVIDEYCLSITASNHNSLSARNLSSAELSKSFNPSDGFELAQLFTDGQTCFSRWVRHGVAAAGVTS